MIYLVIVVLTIATVYLLVRLLSLKKALKGAGKQLREINRELEENRIVKLAVPDKDAEELLMVMNESLQAIREHKNMYAKREKELKQQIENISHDLRTPLTSMLGYLRIMETGNLSPEDREDLQTVIRKAERLQELITQFYEGNIHGLFAFSGEYRSDKAVTGSHGRRLSGIREAAAGSGG